MRAFVNEECVRLAHGSEQFDRSPANHCWRMVLDPAPEARLRPAKKTLVCIVWTVGHRGGNIRWRHNKECVGKAPKIVWHSVTSTFSAPSKRRDAVNER